MQTNKTTARIFPAVLDCENPEFERRLDKCVEYNEQLVAIGSSDAPEFVKKIQGFAPLAGLIGEIVALFFMTPVDSGSVDFIENEPQLVY